MNLIRDIYQNIQVRIQNSLGHTNRARLKTTRHDLQPVPSIVNMMMIKSIVVGTIYDDDDGDDDEQLVYFE